MAKLAPLWKAAIAAVQIAIGALLVAYWIGPERIWIASLAQYAPYPIFLAPAVACTLVSLWLSWRWRAVALLGLACVPGCVMGLSVPRHERGAVPIRVLTYNIKDYVTVRSGAGFGAIAEEISRHDPDVFLLQDAREIADLRTSDPGAARLLFDRRHVYQFGQYVVASRFPLKDCGRGDIPFDGQMHTYVRCVVSADGFEFTVISVHFMTPRFGLAATRHNPLAGLEEWRRNVADRLTQAGELASALASRDRPLLIAGDMNAPITSLTLRTLTGLGLRDAFSVAGGGFGYTWGHSLRTGFSFLRLDHILVDSSFAVADCFVGDAEPSEHRPVIADLFLTR